MDAGKSTLLGVLTHGELDNGRGTARQKLFRHKHEMESGRTSSVGNDILGFNQEGHIVNRTDGHGQLSSFSLCVQNFRATLRSVFSHVMHMLASCMLGLLLTTSMPREFCC